MVAAFAGYLLLLALAALRHRDPVALAAAPSSRISVLVPAHDEAMLIERCVGSLLDQSYPRALYEVVVIADNCADDTAALARAAGARVLARVAPDAAGKGHALRWAMDQILYEAEPPDGVVVVDADTQAEPDFLARMVAHFELGALAVQGDYVLREDGSSRTALRVAAFLLINRVRPAGRAALGLPCSLCGNGMLLARELLVALPWQAFSSTEDLEYAIALRRHGIQPAFALGATVVAEAPPDERAAAVQQLRWEGGKVHLARRWAPRLVGQALRERRLALLDVAFELVLPPLALLMAAALAGGISGGTLTLAGVIPAAAAAPWLFAMSAIPAFVVVGLKAAGAPASTFRALAGAPRLIVRRAFAAHRLLRFRADSWVRTARVAGEDSSSGS